MIRYNISSKKTYKKDGVDKTVWLTVGQLVDTGDRKFIELNMFPGTPFYVFEQKDKAELKVNEEQSMEDVIS